MSANKSDSGTCISFKLSRSNAKPAKSLLGDKDAVIDKKDYLLSVEGNKLQAVIPTPTAKEFIVPLIRKNKWRLKKVSDQNGETTSNKDDDEAASAILKDLQSGKFVGGSSTGEADDTDGLVIPLLMKNKPPVELSDDKLNDLEIRPEQSTIDDYEDMPVDQFGAAMLKGMGWKPGEAIGLNKKGLIEPIEYIAHPGGLGLGATPRPPVPKKTNKIKKPGEVEKKRPMPYKDKDGRVKHMKKIGEEIPEAIPEGFYPGNYGRVMGGPHAGLNGKIIAVDEDNARVILKLAINKQDLSFSQHNVELISKEALSQKHSSHEDHHYHHHHHGSRKQYGLVLPGDNKSSGEGSKYNKSPDRSNSRSYINDRTKREREREREEEITTSERKVTARHYNQQRDRRKRERDNEWNKKDEGMVDERGDIDDSRHCVDRNELEKEEVDYVRDVKVAKMVREGDVKKKSRNKVEECWLRAQLRVRIIDQHYKRGKYYNKKVVVVDVVDPVTCICQTDDNHLLEGVRLNMLETVVPKMADSVTMIVRGEYKGQVGLIVDRNKSKCIATIQLLQTKEMVAIDYDYICEYVGETYL